MSGGIEEAFLISTRFRALITRQQPPLREQRQIGERSDVELRRSRLRLRENSLHDAFVAQSVDGDVKKRIFFLKRIGEGLAAVDSQSRIPAHGAAFFVRLGDKRIV